MGDFMLKMDGFAMLLYSVIYRDGYLLYLEI